MMERSLDLNKDVAAIIKTSCFKGTQMQSLPIRHHVSFTPANRAELKGGGLNRREMNGVRTGREGWGLERASQCSRACNRVVNGALT